MTRPKQSDYFNYVDYTRALEEYCDELESLEPEVFVCSTGLCHYKAQRTWVELTDEDKQIAFDDTQEASGGFWEFADAIEAKLREKNSPHKEKNT